MAVQDQNPKQTNQPADGRKDERKGVEVGRKIDDQANAGNAQGADGGDQSKGKGKGTGRGGQNSQGGQWGLNKGKGGQDSHNKR
jgi:hypothetical protein